MRHSLKPILLGLYLLTGLGQYQERLAALGWGWPLLAYGVLFAALVLALWLTAAIRPPVLRWGLAVVLAGAAVFFEGYARVTANYLTYSQFVSLVYSAGFIGEALQQYGAALIWPLGSGLLLLLGIGVAPRQPSRVPQVLAVAAPFVAVLALSVLLFARAGAGAMGLPGLFTPLVYLNLLAYESAQASVGSRQPVTLARQGGAVGHDIVLVIDESVSGNYLDINTPGGVPSHLGQAPAGVAIFNFGYGAAIANCSADTNVTLRFGGTREDYLRINATQPSIWQYARQAGLATVYIDAQRTGGHLQNLMTRLERQDIQRFIQFDDVPVRDRDMAVARQLIDLLNDGQPQLVVINKVGAHFPVHDKYPDAFMRYRPALPRGGYADISDTGARDGFDGRPDDWQRYRNAYQNTLLWNVGEFFARVFAQADLSRAVLIYTSDHGQDLHERGNPGLDTHCGSDPMPEEGLVPLVVIQGRQLQTLDWQAALPGNKDRSSHYNIFPTLLALMGYDLAAIRPLYGKPLSEPTEDAFSFNYRFNARLGAKPLFKHIDLGQVVTPPGPVDFTLRPSAFGD